MSLYAIERKNGTALYIQITHFLKKEFIDDSMPGDRLPPENELADRFGVNRHTLRRAVSELIVAGILERQHGVGIFVTNQHLDYRIDSSTRFTQTLTDLGVSCESKVIRKMTLIPPSGVIKALKLQEKLSEKTPVLWIETLRSVDGTPFCLISHFIPLRPYGEALHDYSGGSLHALLVERYGRLRRTESLITAVMPQGDDARILGSSQARPLLRVKSVNVLESNDAPIEYAITRFRADRVQLSINMQAHGL